MGQKTKHPLLRETSLSKPEFGKEGGTGVHLRETVGPCVVKDGGEGSNGRLSIGQRGWAKYTGTDLQSDDPDLESSNSGQKEGKQKERKKRGSGEMRDTRGTSPKQREHRCLGICPLLKRS